MTAVSAEQQRDARRHERSERDHEDDERDREREETGLLQVLGEDLVDPVDRACIAELADEELRVSLLRLLDALEDGADLVGRVVGVASDLELDEGGVPVLRDLAGVSGCERRADVLNRSQPGDSLDDVLDRGRERRIARPERAALDEDALAGGLLEAGVEDPVGAAGLARPSRVVVDELRADRAAEHEGDDDEGQPAEGGGLPVIRAPATHAGRKVAIGMGGAGHARSSFLGCVGEWVVEGVEGAVGRDRELEAVSDAGVLDRDGERVLARVPEQQHLDAVALARGELACFHCRRAHRSSFRCVELHASTLGPRRRDALVGKPDSASYRPPIRARTGR